MTVVNEWIEWAGGECPVDGGVAVEVRFRMTPEDADPTSIPESLRWSHFAYGGQGWGDIVAYRIVEPA